MADTTTRPGITVVPANEASCEDLQTIFGTRGQAARCQCQRYWAVTCLFARAGFRKRGT